MHACGCASHASTAAAAAAHARRVDDPIVNGWLFLRYLIIGVYVGVVTVYGFIWWYLYFPEVRACACKLVRT